MHLQEPYNLQHCMIQQKDTKALEVNLLSTALIARWETGQ